MTLDVRVQAPACSSVMWRLPPIRGRNLTLEHLTGEQVRFQPEAGLRQNGERRCPDSSCGHNVTISRVGLTTTRRLLQEIAGMSDSRNAPPKSGWAKMVSELLVNNSDASLAFWKD